MIEHGTQIGEAFVSKASDGSIEGHGQYCDFPVVLRLTPDQRGDKYGYRVAIHMLPMKALPTHD